MTSDMSDSEISAPVPSRYAFSKRRKEGVHAFFIFIDWIVCGCMVHIQHHGDHHEQVSDQQAGVSLDSDLRSCANQLHL